jgi:hypothetical protein
MIEKRHLASIITTVGILGELSVANASTGTAQPPETTAVNSTILSQETNRENGRSSGKHIDTETRGFELASRTRQGDDSGDDGGRDDGDDGGDD